MANSDKNIRIITNKNKSGLPNITFTGYNNDPVVLNVLDDNTISFEGSSGQLFSVSNSVTSGTIFSVNDISGIPSLRIDADGTVGIAEFSGNVGIGIQSPQSKLSVGGDINASIGYSYRINGNMVLNASSLGTGVTLSSLTSVGTLSSGTWNASPISLLYGGTGASTAAQALANLGAAAAGTNADITRLTNLQSIQITIPAAASIGMTIKAAASQTGNYIDLVNSSNVALSWITKDGTFAYGAYFTHNDGRVPGISVQRSGAAGIVARGYNSPNNPAIEVQDNPGTLSVGLYPSGLVYGGVLQAYSSTGSTSTATGALIVAGGAGIAGSLNTSTSFTSSISGLRIINGSLSSATGTIAATNKIQITVSDTDAFLVKNGGGTNIFDIDTTNNVVSVFPSTGSTNSSSGALVITGGVGIGGTLNANSVVTYNRLQNQSFSGVSIGASDGRMGNYGAILGHDRISYGNGVFVTNSSWGAYNAGYSTDGLNWNSSSLPVNQGYPVSIYGNGYFVLAATGATNVLYSTNGISWSQVSIGNTESRSSGTYGNGKYVIVGSGTTYNYSTNLTTWSAGTLPLTGDWRIAYGNGVFVAIAYGTNQLIYSYDGINWNIGNTNTVNRNFMKITYANGKFMVTAWSSGGTYYSYDGINWFSTSNPGGDVYNVAYGNGVYFTSDSLKYTYSSDGFDWSSFVNFSVGYESFQSAYGLNKFITGGRIIDGPTNTVTLEPKFTGEINNVRIGAITPASGDFTNLSSTGSANLVGTVNANNLNILSKVNQTPVLGGFAGTTDWTSSALLTGNSNYALAFGNGLFVSIRRTSNSASFSSDGKRWIASTMPFSGDWLDVAWGKDKFVAVAGAGASGAYSGNGITWTSMNMPANTSGWYAVTYGDEKFVVVGNGATVAYSSNGISWTGAAIANTNWTGIAYGNGTFVAVSGNGSSSAYSYDGLNWNYSTVGGVNNGIKFITYGNGYFIVTNYVSTSINYSRDGINWSTSTRSSSFSIHTDLAYGNGIYSIFNYSEASYSYDAINWLNGNSISSTDWQAVAYGNNRFVATSINTSQVGSIDGPSNTLNLYPKFTGDIDNVRIGAKEPGAAEFTTLAAQQPVRFTANTPTTSTTSGALVVVGGVGIGGSVNSSGRFNLGTLAAPTASSFSGFGTGGLLPSTTYYYKISAIDFNNNESLPSPEYSVTTSASQYGTRFYISTVGGAVGYKLYRTTTSGSYTDSYVQTYRTNQFNLVFAFDTGKSTSTGTPLSITTGNNTTLGYEGSSPSNVIPSLTIPSGVLQVKSPNFTSYAPSSRGVSIETGAFDFIQIRDPYGYNNSVSASTGGTLTPGQTYYYVFTCLDHYGNESLPSQEIAFTADSGGAALFSFSVATVQQATRRWYRTTTSGNYTNSYIGELYDHKDINYPTKNVSPPTSTQFAGARILPDAGFGLYSYIPNIDVAPSARNGAIRKIGYPYSQSLTLTTSGTAGSLLPNTTYYYKYVEVDIFGGSTYPSQEYSIGTGTSTAITINTSSNLWIEAKNYIKIYRSTTSNSYSNAPTYIVNSFPFTDVGDTTFTETPPTSATNITGQLFQNANGSVPQNYLISLAIGPISNSSPFAILAPQNGLSSVTASTGGTLTAGQVYYYVMEPRDVYNFDGVALQPIRFTATAGGAALITPGQINSAYGYVYYNLFRTTSLASWTNTLIATGVRGNFVDINYPTRSGSPNFGYHRARSIVLDNRNNLFVPNLVNQTYGQNLTPTSTPYRTGGNSSGTLTTNTTYYYRVFPFGGYNQSLGYASDEFSYTTGANERNISLSIGGHKTGAVGYRVYRSTSFNNFTNAYYFETQHTDFTDLGFSTLQATPDLGSLTAPFGTTVNRLDQLNGNVFVNTIITGQNGALKIHMKSPVNLSLSSGTGGTLANNTDYFYRVEAVDIYGARSFPSEESWINTSSNNAVTITWNEVPGTYYYRIYRTTTSQSYTNTLIAGIVKDRTFTDLNYPNTSGTPYSFSNYVGTTAGALFQVDNAKNFGVLPRTIISNVDNSQSAWNTDFSLRLVSPPVGSASGALLQVGAGFTNNSSAGFSGTTYGTQIAIGAASGFTGSLLDAQTAGVSRFRINFDGSTTIGSTTGTATTNAGALVISGGVGIGQSLFTSTAYASSISGAIFSNGSATLSGTYTQNNSSTTAFAVKNAGGTSIFNIDTSNSVVSVLASTASTSTTTGALIVSGGAGFGGSLYVSGASNISSVTLKNGVITGTLSGTATTATNVNVVSALTNSTHPVLFTPATGTASGAAVSTEPTFTYNPFTDILSVSGLAVTSSIGSTNTSTGALVVNGGLGVSGQLTFTRASFGFTGITSNPTMAFIGNTTASPINLTVLTDNSLSWEGTSGQLFSIDNNLTSGEIFSVSDISGLPIISASAGQTVSLNEFGGFTKIGNGSISSTGASNTGADGSLVVYGGIGITGNANIGGTVRINNNTQSSSTSSGALVVNGGVGITGNLNTGGFIKFGTNTFSKNLGVGDIGLDNGSADTPGTLYYWQNSRNFGTDVYYSGSGTTRYRIVKELNESGGAELWSIDREGIVYRSAYAVGETINTAMYNYSDLGMSATTTISSTSYTTFATITYTPKSSSSYLWIEFSCTYTVAGGGGDDFWSNIEVAGVEQVNSNQVWTNGAGGGTRSGVLFPLACRYTNSGTAGIAISIRSKRGTSDDNATIYGNSASGYMRIQEIGR